MVTKKRDKPSKTRHLGRGLEALLGPITPGRTEASSISSATAGPPVFAPDRQLGNSLRQIQLDRISPNPYQPRTVWDKEDMEKLAESIKTNGLLQPVLVRPAGNQKYQLIAGERRFKAAQLAGMESIPATVRDATDTQLLELALIENIHRTNLNPLERAGAYQKYLTSFSLTHAEAAERLSESRSVISNYLRLLELPEQIKQMLSDGTLTMGHARAILALPTDELRDKLAKRAMAGRLSVREVERLVRRYLAEPGRGEKQENYSKPPYILDLERKIAGQLATKVTIDTRKNTQRGKITIEFYSLEDFDRITEKLGLTTAEEV